MKEGERKMSYKYKKEFKKYTQLMQHGLEIGEKKYGSGVVKDNMLEMMEEEIRDFSTYGFLLYLKLQLLKQKFIELKDLKEVTNSESENSFRRTHK